jgi:hypothetical protein
MGCMALLSVVVVVVVVVVVGRQGGGYRVAEMNWKTGLIGIDGQIRAQAPA